MTNRVIAAIILSVVLVGCTPSVILDREISVPGGLTVNVPSKWIQIDKSYVDGEEDKYGSKTFEGDDNYVAVTWHFGDKETPEEHLSDMRQMEDVEDWKQEHLGSEVIDGRRCEKYTYTLTYNEGIETAYIAYIIGTEYGWKIVSDSEDVMQSTLEIVHIS